MKCRLCGKQLPLGTAECDNCGAKVEWKKYIWLTAGVTALAVALVAGLVCGIVLGIQEKPVENTNPPATENPTEATPEPTQTEPTDGTQSTEPTTESTEPPTDPTQPPTEHTDQPTPGAHGITFVYDGASPKPWLDLDFTDCVVGYFYYLNTDSGDVFLVCEECVIQSCCNSYMVFYVKETEPNRIYASPKTDFSQSSVIYETTAQQINQIGQPPYQYENSSLLVLEDNRRLLWLDCATGTATVMMEQHYIMSAGVYGVVSTIDGIYYLEEIDVWFVGKLSEDDPLTGYIYNYKTGQISLQPEL